MSTLRIGGFDPSYSNFGMVKGDLNLIKGRLTNVELSLEETKPDSKNKAVRKNSKDLVRVQALYKAMTKFFADVDIICVEIPVGSQSANSMKSYGVCVALVATLPQVLIEVTPAEVKMAATKSKTASKRDMIDWAVSKYPDANWLTIERKGVLVHINKNEHLADALATIHAGVKTNQFKQIKLGYLANNGK